MNGTKELNEILKMLTGLKKNYIGDKNGYKRT